MPKDLVAIHTRNNSSEFNDQTPRKTVGFEDSGKFDYLFNKKKARNLSRQKTQRIQSPKQIFKMELIEPEDDLNILSSFPK